MRELTAQEIEMRDLRNRVNELESMVAELYQLVRQRPIVRQQSQQALQG